MAGKPRVVWEAALFTNGLHSIKPQRARTLPQYASAMIWENDTPEIWQGTTAILIAVKEVGDKKVGEEVGYFNYLESEVMARQWIEWQKNRLLEQQTPVSMVFDMADCMAQDWLTETDANVPWRKED